MFELGMSRPAAEQLVALVICLHVSNLSQAGANGGADTYASVFPP
jgi:hypothetical protein